MSVPLTGGGYYGPGTGRVDIGGWLGQAWALFSARAGVWVAAFLLYFLLVLLLWLLWAVPTGLLQTMQQTYLSILHHTHSPLRPQNPFVAFAKSHALGLVISGIDGIFCGGFYKMALRQARGEAISVLGLFSAFPQALPLLLVGIVASATSWLLEGLLVWILHQVGISATNAVSSVNLLGILLADMIWGLLMFAPLLIVDQQARAVEAILGSLALLKGQMTKAVLAYFLLTLINGVGGVACGVGMLVTYPLFLISIAAGYLAMTQGTPGAAWPQPAFPQAGVWPPPPTAERRE